MIFRCVTHTVHPSSGKRKRTESYDSPAKRTKRSYKEDSTDEDDQDKIHEFRRVQIVQREYGSSTGVGNIESRLRRERQLARCIAMRSFMKGTTRSMSNLFISRDNNHSPEDIFERDDEDFEVFRSLESMQLLIQQLDRREDIPD